MQSRPAHYNTRYKHDLTPRQTAVLDLMAEGRTNAEIAERLGLTLDGAKWHVREILGKLGMESREEAVAWWRRYRRFPARGMRVATSAIGWFVWKPAAIGGSLLGAVAAAGLGFFVLRGGDGAQAFEDLHGCEAEDMRLETAIEARPDSTRLTLSIALREADWYEGIFKTFHLSDREVESPCRLETTATVGIAAMEPLEHWAGEGPAPVVATRRVETEPPGLVKRNVRARLVGGPATPVLTVELFNSCAPGGAVLGADIQLDDMFVDYRGQVVTVELPHPRDCTDTRMRQPIVTPIDSP
jgi:DNA-binding CsgD family transcriptional regulator